MWAAQVGVQGLGKVPLYFFFPLLVGVRNTQTKERTYRRSREAQGTLRIEGRKGKKSKGPPEGKIPSCRRPLELSIADNGGRQATSGESGFSR